MHKFKMERKDTDTLVRQLAAGFDALRDEYRKLGGQHQALEWKLATAREQYNQLAKLCGSGDLTTPPLSLSSTQKLENHTVPNVVDILEGKGDEASRVAAEKVRAAEQAALRLCEDADQAKEAASNGVRIWAGPSADRQEIGSSVMPSISESPLEQDFTIEGKPSSLGCPFASMAKKKLSSHAASVLSRYNHSSLGGQSTSLSSVNRVNGKESLSRRASQRASLVDPIRAEICGLSDHEAHSLPPETKDEVPTSASIKEDDTPENQENTETGVCPIRFLDQHSPEEVATYFERHKHELPRSHETCVRRYQSNEEQIRELDEKYGNLVSMIQGLGATHKDMLREEPEPADEEGSNAIDDAKVRKWASTVSPTGQAAQVEDGDEERLPHFERPLREIRVGESPSRPWGIPVPSKYFEKPEDTPENQADVVPTNTDDETHQAEFKKPDMPSKTAQPSMAKCPFSFGQPRGSAAPQQTKQGPNLPDTAPIQKPLDVPEPNTKAEPNTSNGPGMDSRQQQQQSHKPSTIFTGPVFFGYSAEDVAKILQAGGTGFKSQ